MDEFDYFAFLQSLTPEQMQQMQGMGTLDERGQSLEEQLAAAQALQNRATAQRGTLGGAIGSGLGGVIDAVRGGMQERDVRQQQADVLGQKDAGRTAYSEALRRFIQQRQQAGVQDAMRGGAAKAGGMLPPEASPVSFFGR